jgi:hypothetical protein
MRTSLISLSLAVLAVVSFGATPDDRTQPPEYERASAANSVSTFEATHATQKLRVTLLGVTKGCAFLKSQELVVDGARKHGNNVISWLRVAVLVEQLGDKADSLGAIDVEIRTADQQQVVENLKVQQPGNPDAIGSRTQGIAIRMLDYQQLASETFPTAPPQVEKPAQSRVLLMTWSGSVRETHQAELRLKFGSTTEPEEFVFKDVPLP